MKPRIFQIELTTSCRLKCKMCIRYYLESKSHGQGMTIGLYKRITPYMKNLDVVVLSGWSETLFHPGLCEIISITRRQGPQVGFVTSGYGLNETYERQLLRAGLNFLGFSLAGATPQIHNSIRINSDLNAIVESINRLQFLIKTSDSYDTHLHLVFLMLKSNIHELLDVVRLTRQLGIDQLFVTNMIHITSPPPPEEPVFVCSGTSGYEEVLDQAESLARTLGIKLRRPALSPVTTYVCEENPLNNLYISTDGQVAPCVYLNAPLPPLSKKIYCGNTVPHQLTTFGKLGEMDLKAIWEVKEYKAFRRAFLLRKLGGRLGLGNLFPPPPPCRTCHKMLGF